MATFLSDSFTDTAGTDLASHTGETGATWTEHGSYTSGVILISAENRARGNGFNISMYHASGTPSDADYDVEAVVRCVTGLSGALAAVAGRIDTGANTFYYLRITSGGIQLTKVVAGTTTVLGTYANTASAGNDYTLKLEMRGTAIKGYLDGVERISVTDSAISAAGKAGVYLNANTGSGTAPTTGFHVESILGADTSGGGGGTKAPPVFRRKTRFFTGR